ncbi:MAG: TlpA disulfide reductase family protein [Bacteroidota bacterium]
MKYLITATILLFAFNLSAQRCQIDTDKIQPNQVMTIHYDPTGTDLVGEEVFGVAQIFDDKMRSKSYDVDLKMNDEGSYTGKFKVPQKAHVVALSFENETQKVVDNNDKQGYVYVVHSGDQISPEAYLTAFYAVGPYARSLEIKSNATKAKMYFDKAIGGDATKKMHPQYINAYASLLQLEKDKEGFAQLEPHIEATLDDTKGLSEKDMTNLYNTARMVKAEDLSKRIKEKIMEEFPKGKMATAKKFEDFRKNENVEELLAMHQELEAITKKDKDFENQFRYATEVLISRLVKAKDFEKVQQYISVIKNPSNKAAIYNNLAWDLAGGGLEEEATNIDFAEKISKRSLEWTKEAMTSAEAKPDYYTARQWKKASKYNYGMYSDTYALTAFKKGKTADAVQYQKIAVESYEFRDAEMNHRYSVYLEKEKGAKAAMTFMEKMISEGHANSALKNDFEKLYKANVSIEEAYTLYLAQLEKEAKAKHLEEIRKSMIEKDAPNFALKNLNGETVSLESLRGKVVIVDFWATWCGPCIASFPGMQKAVDKFKADDEVAFVFIDTWESGKPEAKEKKAKEFIEANNYSFNVLMDLENTMVADYGVNGIPTKFILDKDGKIRFSSRGFSGNDDSMVEEISNMVDILKNDKTSNAAKMGTRP